MKTLKTLVQELTAILEEFPDAMIVAPGNFYSYAYTRHCGVEVLDIVAMPKEDWSGTHWRYNSRIDKEIPVIKAVCVG